MRRTSEVSSHRDVEEELRSLGGRLIRAQEEERSRLARELHDDLSQQLALRSIELGQLEQQIPGSLPALALLATALRNRTQGIALDIRRLSYRLHPAKLDHLGLAAATKSLCEELAVHHQIAIAFTDQGFPSRLPRDVTLCVFRITQEALQNAIVHSGARKVEVRLRRTAAGVRLRVADMGRGFDVECREGQCRTCGQTTAHFKPDPGGTRVAWKTENSRRGLLARHWKSKLAAGKLTVGTAEQIRERP